MATKEVCRCGEDLIRHKAGDTSCPHCDRVNCPPKCERCQQLDRSVK